MAAVPAPSSSDERTSGDDSVRRSLSSPPRGSEIHVRGISRLNRTDGVRPRRRQGRWTSEKSGPSLLFTTIATAVFKYSIVGIRPRAFMAGPASDRRVRDAPALNGPTRLFGRRQLPRRLANAYRSMPPSSGKPIDAPAPRLLQTDTASCAREGRRSAQRALPPNRPGFPGRARIRCISCGGFAVPPGTVEDRSLAKYARELA